MAGKKNVEQIARELAEPVLKKHDLILWNVEYVKEGADWFLKYYIDKDIEGGIDLKSCEAFNREMSDILDEKDPIEGYYWLEVSSPGLDRELSEDWHYDFLNGEVIEVLLYKAVDSEKTKIGKLISKEGSLITIETADGKNFAFDEKDASKVRRYIEI